MEKLKFYDLKARKAFMSDKYQTVSKKVRGRTVTFAKTTAPSGISSTRILSNKK